MNDELSVPGPYYADEHFVSGGNGIVLAHSPVGDAKAIAAALNTRLTPEKAREIAELVAEYLAFEVNILPSDLWAECKDDVLPELAKAIIDATEAK